jgi:hypothetical protein
MRVFNLDHENAVIEVNYWLVPDDKKLKPSIRKRAVKMSDISSIEDVGQFIEERGHEVEKGVTLHINEGMEFIVTSETYGELLDAWNDWLSRVQIG